ncbi:MAG TPA: hypothetical protein VGR47_16240 [Terracidiphilus sp.]|nr:hypothetical protein [Terracidiphilus sp.]
MLTRVPKPNCRSDRNSTEVRGITICLSVVTLALASSATARSFAQSSETTPREEFQQYVTQLQANPSDNALRTKIIQLALTLDPKPAVPEDAAVDAAKGKTIFASASSPDELKAAAAAFAQASQIAPWVPDNYYNEGLALEKVKQYDDAIRDLNFYLLAAPGASDTADVRGKIEGIKYEMSKAASEAQDNELLARKYGAGADPLDLLYRYGGAFSDLRIDGLGNTHGVSLKISTVRDGAAMYDELMVCDLDVMGLHQIRLTDLNGSGNIPFVIRTSRGQANFVMNYDQSLHGDMEIILSPAANTTSSIRTSLSELYRERAREAYYAKFVRSSVGSRQFLGVPETVVLDNRGFGVIVLFDTSALDHIDDGDWRALEPSLVVFSSYSAGGNTHPCSGTSDLGIIDGARYHVEYESDGTWNIFSGSANGGTCP